MSKEKLSFCDVEEYDTNRVYAISLSQLSVGGLYHGYLLTVDRATDRDTAFRTEVVLGDKDEAEQTIGVQLSGVNQPALLELGVDQLGLMVPKTRCRLSMPSGSMLTIVESYLANINSNTGSNSLSAKKELTLQA